MSDPDAAAIRRSLSAGTIDKLDALELFESIDSTNTYLLQQAPPQAGRFRVVVADQQTAGRGRHARTWYSPPRSGVYLSIAYTFADMPAQLSALTLALGVGVARALHATGVEGVMLKWPNDILVDDGKLGGILTELQSRGDAGVPTVVAGVGINVAFSAPPELGADAASLHRPVDLRSVVAEPPRRADLAAIMIERLFACLECFGDAGFGEYRSEWQALDWLHGRDVTVEIADGPVTGRAAGIDDDGALLIDTERGRERLIAGSVTAARSPAAG